MNFSSYIRRNKNKNKAGKSISQYANDLFKYDRLQLIVGINSVLVAGITFIFLVMASVGVYEFNELRGAKAAFTNEVTAFKNEVTTYKYQTKNLTQDANELKSEVKLAMQMRNEINADVSVVSKAELKKQIQAELEKQTQEILAMQVKAELEKQNRAQYERQIKGILATQIKAELKMRFKYYYVSPFEGNEWEKVRMTLIRYAERIVPIESLLGDRITYKDYMKFATGLYYKADYDGALERYEKAIKKDDTNAIAWYSKGLTLHMLGRYKEALIATEQAIVHEDDLSMAIYIKARSLAQLGRTKEALKTLQETIMLNSRFKDIAGKEEDFNSLKDNSEFKKLISNSSIMR